MNLVREMRQQVALLAVTSDLQAVTQLRVRQKTSSGKTVVDADVFGRIYDAYGNSTFENRGRIGTIEEIPPGTSDFEIRVSVPANQPTPLKLKNFKASGFAGRVRPFYYDDFEYDK